MKNLRLTSIILLALALNHAPVSANVVGYVPVPFPAGASFFGNPLQNTNASLSFLFPTAPDGSSVALWNPSTPNYGPMATFSSGSWSTDFLLAPGTGACLLTDTLFTNTFVGEVLNYDGSTWDGSTIVASPPFAGSDGLYLWNSKFASLGGDHSGLLWDRIVGRAPNDGEVFWRFDTTSQTFLSTTYMSGAWDNGNPTLAVEEAGFFDIGGTGLTPYVVPEPGSLAIVVLGILACMLKRRLV